MLTKVSKYPLGGLGLLCLLLALGFSLTPESRTAGKTLLILPEVLPNVPVRPLRWFAHDPLIQEVVILASPGPLPADLYLPKNGDRHAAVILALGVTANFQDEALVAFSKALARTGVVVMVPKSQALADGFLLPQEPENLVAAFQFLQQQPLRQVPTKVGTPHGVGSQGGPVVDPQRIGFGGFSVGASLATIAAADPRIRDSVAFVNFLGGYLDLGDYFGAITTGLMQYQGQSLPWDQDPRPRRILTKTLLHYVEHPQDKSLLESALPEGRLLSNADLLRLQPESLALYHLLTNREPERVQELLQALSPRHRQLLDTLSPRPVLSQLKAKLFLMTDRRDDLVPYVETRKMADALEGRYQRYTELDIFEHVRPERAVDAFTFLGNVRDLFRHLRLVLRELT